MPIIGIESVLYGVADIGETVRFFTDLGLPLAYHNKEEACFRLEEGSRVLIRHIDDSAVPKSVLQGYGIKEAIWGVDSQESLDALAANLGRDRELRRDADGTVRFLTDCGIPLGLRVFDRKKATYAPDPVNASGNVQRLNQMRKWRTRARPKTLNHIVFAVHDYHQTFAFFRDRLGFRLTDHQKNIGIYSRCDGAHEHHSMFLADCSLPGMGNAPGFHHINFGVEDIDEMMTGANYMMRHGWERGFLGNGRHRISSALFSYWKCPGGGEAEYGADTDYVDDNWIPREWEFLFGTASWMQELPDFLQEEPAWDVQFMTEFVPTPKQ